MTENKDMQDDDNVDGDDITVGAISNVRGVAIGEGATATVTIQQLLKRKSVIIILIVIAVIAAGAVFLSKALEEPVEIILPTHTPTPIPSATPTPFAPAIEGEALIVVVPFDLTTDSSSDAHRKIYAQIVESIEVWGLPGATVELDPNVV